MYLIFFQLHHIPSVRALIVAKLMLRLFCELRANASIKTMCPSETANSKLGWKIMFALYKKLKQSAENDRRKHWVKVINLIQTPDIVHKSLWEKDKQDNVGIAYWSCQSTMYWSVSLNGLLGSRGNQPDDTRPHTLLSPVKRLETEAMEGKARTKEDRGMEIQKDTMSISRKMAVVLAGTWGICSLGSIFRSPFSKHIHQSI